MSLVLALSISWPWSQVLGLDLGLGLGFLQVLGLECLGLGLGLEHKSLKTSLGVTNLIHDRRRCVDFTLEVRRMWLDVSTQA